MAILNRSRSQTTCNREDEERKKVKQPLSRCCCFLLFAAARSAFFSFRSLASGWDGKETVKLVFGKSTCTNSQTGFWFRSEAWCRGPGRVMYAAEMSEHIYSVPTKGDGMKRKQIARVKFLSSHLRNRASFSNSSARVSARNSAPKRKPRRFLTYKSGLYWASKVKKQKTRSSPLTFTMLLRLSPSPRSSLCRRQFSNCVSTLGLFLFWATNKRR